MVATTERAACWVSIEHLSDCRELLVQVLVASTLKVVVNMHQCCATMVLVDLVMRGFDFQVAAVLGQPHKRKHAFIFKYTDKNNLSR